VRQTHLRELLDEDPSPGSLRTVDLRGSRRATPPTSIDNVSAQPSRLSLIFNPCAHHQGAIEIARAEQADSLYEPAKTMAANIIRTQSEEITKMTELQKSFQ